MEHAWIMDKLNVVFLLFCVGHCYGQNTQRKLTRLQLDVDSLRTLAVELKLDIDGLQSWRNATFASPHNTGVIDSDNECVESRLKGEFEQSYVMEGRVSYIIKGLEAEKVVLRDVMEDIRHIEAKLNLHVISTKSKDAEINYKLNLISRIFETSIDEALGRFEDLSNRLDATAKTNGDISKQVTHPPKQTSTTVQDTTVTMEDQTEYYARMRQDGWLQYNCLYKLFTQYSDFSTAVKSCEDNGASLAEITDTAELKFLNDNMESGRYYWLGASDLQTEGEWRWLSGQLVEDGNWGREEPNNYGGDQDCLLVNRATKAKYRDYWCVSRMYYICKLQ